MNIVIATPILYDKTSPFNHLLKDIIQGFVDSGNQAIRFVATESLDDHSYDLGIVSNDITYIPLLRKKTEKSNIIVRYLNDSLTNIKMARKIRKLKDGDVLFEDVSFSSFWTVRAAKKRGMRVVAMLQDVWPDNAVQSGLIKEGSLIYKFFEIWQKYVYKHADKLICISDDMKDFIVSKGVPAEKIEVIYNWGYSDDLVNIPWEKNEFVKKYQLDPQKFYAVYAGNIGRMQNVQLLVKAAKELQNNDNIKFLIIGDGVEKDKIANMAEEIDNITMLPMQPSELATSIYSAAGVNIIPLVEGGTKTALPSKTGVVLSCGQPVVFAFGGESRFARLINESGVGASVDADDYKGLSNWISKIAKKKNTDKEQGHKVFKKLFVKSENVKKYTKLISEN